MAVTVASFVANFPEFAGANGKVPLQQFLDNAATFTPAAVWGDFTDQGVQLRAAQALALSPFGRGMALVNKDGSTVYDQRLEDITQRIAPVGLVT